MPITGELLLSTNTSPMQDNVAKSVTVPSYAGIGTLVVFSFEDHSSINYVSSATYDGVALDWHAPSWGSGSQVGVGVLKNPNVGTANLVFQVTGGTNVDYVHTEVWLFRGAVEMPYSFAGNDTDDGYGQPGDLVVQGGMSDSGAISGDGTIIAEGVYANIRYCLQVGVIPANSIKRTLTITGAEDRRVITIPASKGVRIASIGHSTQGAATVISVMNWLVDDYLLSFSSRKRDGGLEITAASWNGGGGQALSKIFAVTNGPTLNCWQRTNPTPLIGGSVSYAGTNSAMVAFCVLMCGASEGLGVELTAAGSGPGDVTININASGARSMGVAAMFHSGTAVLTSPASASWEELRNQASTSGASTIRGYINAALASAVSGLWTNRPSANYTAAILPLGAPGGTGVKAVLIG